MTLEYLLNAKMRHYEKLYDALVELREAVRMRDPLLPCSLGEACDVPMCKAVRKVDEILAEKVV